MALSLAGIFSLPRAGATTYFVAPNGSDANPGTNLAAPFQTIQQVAAKAGPGDTCMIRAGVYHETLSPTRSGTVNSPITFVAYSNEVVTIDAADAVTGWTALSNGIYQASAGWDLGEGFNQVFVDGVMQHEARYPDYGAGDVLHPGTVAVVVSTTNTALITSAAWGGKPDNYWAGAWFVGGVGYSWAWQSAQVLSSTGTSILVDASTQTPNWWFTGAGAGYLWGKFSLLDADNEWYLQTNAGANTLYLRITGGANPSTHSVEMKHRNWCVDINGWNYVTVSGINLWAGAARLAGAGNILQNSQAQFLSHFTTISQGYLENGGSDQGSGVLLNGASNIVRGCTLANTAGCGVYTSGAGNTITRNHIYNTDYSGTYACAIAIHGAGDVVTFNTACASGRDILRPEGVGSTICFNDLSNPGLLCKDLGVIYAWGVSPPAASQTSARIAFNWIHDNNYPVPSPLVYLDNYDQNFVVDHNVCWNTGGDSGIRVNGPALGHQIYNNTLFNCADVGAYAYDQWPASNPNPSLWTNDVNQYWASNNLFLGSSPQTQLVNWTNDDFRLQPDAPAIDAGVVIPGFTDGYVGKSPDLGAYEMGGTAWSAGTGSRPTLTGTNTGGGGLVLRASVDAAYYQLYCASNLAPPLVWNPVTNVPFVSGIQWSVTLANSGNSSRYYRLQGN
jgi:hypothetical protein